MRVLAARFADRRIASAVRDLLRRQMRLDPPEIDIAPLAADEPATDETVLAARFSDGDAAEAAALLRDAGGVIVANVDERWTRPRSEIAAHAYVPNARRGGVHS